MKVEKRFFLKKVFIIGSSMGWTQLVKSASTDELSDSDRNWTLSGKWDGLSDVTLHAQSILDSGKNPIDFFGLPGKIMSSLMVPKGLEVKNINFIAGVPGMKMLLVDSNVKVSGALTGTGTAGGVTEWGVYPAHAGVDDVQLDLEISKVSVGVQVWNRGSGSIPQRWSGRLRFFDLEGGGKNSNGYGLLLAGAENCSFDVFSKNTPRHCVYISNGSRGNKITLRSVGSGGAPLQFGAYKKQKYVEYNEVDAVVSDMKPSSSASAYAVSLVGKVRNNKIKAQVSSSPLALGGVLFRALDTNSVPYKNIVAIHHFGGYSGTGMVQSDASFENVVEVSGGGRSSAKGGGSIIAVNNYNGITRPIGDYKNSLLVKSFSWDSYAPGARGVGVFVSYAPVSISRDAEKGLEKFGSKMFATDGGGRVVKQSIF